jgi:glc operon protein GlcG
MTDRRLALARSMVDRGMQEWRTLGLDCCAVAVDAGGQIIAAARADLCAWPAVEAARRKAATSAALRLTTAMVSGAIDADPAAARALAGSPDMLAVPGGAPLFLDNRCVGGIGIAGNHWSEDLLILERTLQSAGAAE